MLDPSSVTSSAGTELLARLFGSFIYGVLGQQAHGSGGAIPNETPLTLYGVAIVSSTVDWILIAIVLYTLFTVVKNMAGRSASFLEANNDGIGLIFRLILALVAVMPGGFSTNLNMAQLSVIKIAAYSSQLADETWSKVIQLVGQEEFTGKPYNLHISKLNTSMTIDTFANYYSCILSTPDPSGKLWNQNNGNPPLSRSIPPLTKTLVGPDAQNTYEGTVASNCAEKVGLDLPYWINVPAETEPTYKSIYDPNDSNLAQMNKNRFVKYQADLASYGRDVITYNIAVKQVWPMVYSVYQPYMNGQNPPDSIFDQMAAQLQDIKDQYYTKLTDWGGQVATKSHYQLIKIFAEQLKEFGWVSAGNFYKLLGNAQQAISSAMNNSITQNGRGVDFSKIKTINQSGDMQTYYNVVTENKIKAAIQQQESKDDLNNQKDQKAVHAIMHYLGFDIFDAGIDEDPVATMQNLGQTLTATGTFLWIGTTVLSSVTADLPFVSSIAKKYEDVLDKIALFLLMAGIFLGTLLPSIPWALFLFGVVAWFIHVVEMFIAAPFWIVANAMPGGKSMVANVAYKGFNNILYVFIYPIFLIGGLIAGMAVSWLGMYLLNSFIYAQFSSVYTLLSVVGAVIGTLLLYIIMAYLIMINSFGLILNLPKTILGWISISQPGLNQFGDQSNLHSSIFGGISSIQNKVSRMSDQLQRTVDGSRRKYTDTSTNTIQDADKD